jgi:hypothetical protein
VSVEEFPSETGEFVQGSAAFGGRHGESQNGLKDMFSLSHLTNAATQCRGQEASIRIGTTILQWRKPVPIRVAPY